MDDVDTFLTTVYCMVDDLYRHELLPHKPPRRGHRPEMADSEVLTLAVLAQWRADRSERAMLRYARRYWRRYFPRLLDQSAFNRRVRDLAGVLCRLGPAIAEQVGRLGGTDLAYEVLDGVGVPLVRRCRGRRHRCFGDEASVGRGGSDHAWYYGVKLLAAIRADGLWSGFVYAPADTEERWLVEALLCWRQDPSQPLPGPVALAPILGPAHRQRGQRRGPTGPVVPRHGAGRASGAVYLGDLGLRGAVWQRHWAQAYGARVLTKDAYTGQPSAREQRAARRWLSGLRQVVETGFQWLQARFDLAYPRARTSWGLRARVGAKLAAFNVAVAINQQCGRPPFAFPELFP